MSEAEYQILDDSREFRNVMLHKGAAMLRVRELKSIWLSPNEFQKAYAQNKDNIKTVIRFNN